MDYLNYNNIREEQNKSLPKFFAGNLECSSKISELGKISDKLISISKNNDYWIMYTDRIAINEEINDEGSLSKMLEAEFRESENTTIKIKLLSGTKYLITTYFDSNKHEAANLSDSKNEIENSKYNLYYEINLDLRQDLQRNNSSNCYARYKIWFKQDNSCWKAFAQQFIGFGNGNGD